MIGETNQSSPEKIPALNFSHEGWLMISYSFSGPWGFEMAEYHYDALGRRMLKNEPNDLPREYTYDGDNVLISSWGGMPTKYVNGPGIDNPLSVKVAGSSNWSYPLADHLGTQGVTDSFGNGSPGFTGRENDTFTELYYYRARMYDPQLGRFTAEDPIGFEGGDINLYGYVWNNPLRFRDPMGLDAYDNEQLWRAQQDLINALAGPIEFGIGFGDTTLFGLSRSLRQWQGIDDPNLDCSVWYQAGGWTATAVQAAAGGVGLYRAGLSLSVAGGGQRVFWSGRDLAKNAAQNYAGSIGGTTLEMTAGGRIAAGAEPFLPKALANSLWGDLSASFANSARGSASVIHNGTGIGRNSIWAGVEYPILNRNSVTLTYHVVFP